ncbi:hypothetical protein ACWEQP_18015 [Streptomyces sp. NPDC004044]
MTRQVSPSGRADGRAGHAVSPQLVMMAYLHRFVNEAGFIDREHGVGRRRVDLLIRQPYTAADGSRAVQREALELKVWRQGRTGPRAHRLLPADDTLRAHRHAAARLTAGSSPDARP